VSAMEMVRQWQKTVKDNLVPNLHGHQAKALAAFSFAMAQAGSCTSGLIAAAVPGAASPASVRRRLERTLSNHRIDATGAMLGLSSSLMRHWGGCGRRILLILDETPKANDLRCMRLSVAYHKRTVPLLSVCYRPDDPPMPMPVLVRWMLRQVAACVPRQDVVVTLLADRGLCWPTLIRQCRRLGWHYLLRLQSSTRVRLPEDGGIKAVQELAPRPGTHAFVQDVRIFKKARWLRANVAAVWEPHAKEAWLLVSDEPASYRGCCRRYCKRTWCEESHRDDKSSGFNWQRSHVKDPDHAQRLVLVMALASLLCIAQGVSVIKRGLRYLFEPRRQRQLSVFQLGKRWLEYALVHNEPLIPLPSMPPP
jgi:hypothetical protein